MCRVPSLLYQDLFLYFYFTAIADHHLGSGAAAAAAVGLYFLYHIKTINYFAENHMFAVQPGCFLGGYEELGAVRIGSGIGHG